MRRLSPVLSKIQIVAFGLQFIHAIYLALAIDYEMMKDWKEAPYYYYTIRIQFFLSIYLCF